jgi:hypothetical protein
MFNHQILRQSGLVLTQPASIRNVNGKLLEQQMVIDSINEVFNQGQQVITDCDECLVTDDLGVLHFKKLFKDPANYQIPQEDFEEILIPDHLQRGLYTLGEINPDLATDYLKLKNEVIETYFEVKKGISKTKFFIDKMIKFDKLTFDVESCLRENASDVSHPNIKNYLLIRCRLYHALCLNRLDETYKGLVRHNNDEIYIPEFSSAKTIIFDTLSQSDGSPTICSTNLIQIVNANFDNSFAQSIHGTQYGECIDSNTFIGRLDQEPVFKDEKINIVLRQLGLPETFNQASETIGFMAGDSASNDLPAMIASLSGKTGCVMVRVKGDKDKYHDNVVKWNSQFLENGISQDVVLNRVFFVDERQF